MGRVHVRMRQPWRRIESKWFIKLTYGSHADRDPVNSCLKTIFERSISRHTAARYGFMYVGIINYLCGILWLP